MANGQGSIDEVIGQQAIDQVAKFEAAMKKLADQMTDTLSIANQLNSATGLKTVQAGVTAINNTTKATKDLTAAMALEVVERQHNNNALKTEAKERSAVVGAYTNLDAAQQKLAKDARDMGIQFGINSQQFKDAAKSSNEYLGRLKAVDEALGNSRRNVGNYQGAVFSLSQVIRELPSFTYSAQQGFLAIGNNMPILIDQFKLLREQVGSTGKAIGIFARSIFSFVNVFTILSGLFTIFYKDIMKFVTGTNLAREVSDELAASLKQGAYSTAIDNFRQLEKSITLVKSGLLSQKAALDFYNSTMGETAGKVKSWGEAEDLIRSKGADWLEFIKLKTQATALYARSATIAAEAAAADFESPSIGDKAKAFYRGSYFKLGNIGKSLKELNDIEKKSLEESTNNTKVELLNKSEAIKKAADDISAQLDKLSEKTGFNLFGNETKDKSTKSKKEINRIAELKQLYENELNELKIYHATNQETEIEFQAKVLRLNAEYATKKIDSVKNLSKEEHETALGWKAKILEDTKQINDDIAKNSLELFRKLEEDGAKSYETDKKQLDEKKKAWDKAYEHFISLVDKLDAEEDKKRNAKIARETKEREDALKRTEIYWDNYMSAGQSAMSIIESIADGVFAREMQQFDVKERRLKDFYDNEKRFIEQSGFSSLQKQKMQQKLDAETEAKRKQIDRDRITALRKQASFEKAFNVSQAIAETAIAVLRALNDKTVPYPVRIAYAISAGASGAAQIARVLATPLPQYARGRKGGRKEWAVVGESGQEAIVHNGRVELTPNQATVTLLPEGADVIPNHELIKNAAYVKLSKQGTVTTDKLQAALIESYERNTNELRSIKQVLIDKKFFSEHKDLSGYEAYRQSKVQ